MLSINLSITTYLVKISDFALYLKNTYVQLKYSGKSTELW